MSFSSSYLFLAFLATVFALPSVQGDEDTLSPFGEKVNAIIPEKTKTIIFNQDYKDLEEIEKTEKILPIKFSKTLGTPLDPCSVKQVNAAITRLLKSKQEGGLFQAYISATSDILEQQGKLNSDTLDHFAKKYVKALNKSAKKVPEHYSITDTFPALVVAQANFLKHENITSEKVVNQFIESLTQELDKSAMKGSEGASAEYNLPNWLTDIVTYLKYQGMLYSLHQFIHSFF